MPLFRLKLGKINLCEAKRVYASVKEPTKLRNLYLQHLISHEIMFRLIQFFIFIDSQGITLAGTSLTLPNGTVNRGVEVVPSAFGCESSI